VLFPAYYQAVTSKIYENGLIDFLGFSIKNTVLYDYALAVAYLFVAVASIFLSGVADYSGKRRFFMQAFTILGASACFGMYWFDGTNILYGIVLVAVAAVGYEIGVLFYNSFLPQIATPDMHDKISAKGYAWGYAGSMSLLAVNLIMLSYYDSLGFLSKLDVLRSSFLQVGIWWFLIAQIAIYFLKSKQSKHHKLEFAVIEKGLQELKQVWQFIQKRWSIKGFLLSFFFYSMGLQTLMLVAVLFGTNEIGISGSKLIITILIIQFVAIIGASFFAFVSKKWSNKTSIASMLFIWTVVCLASYFVSTELHFYILAAAVGLVMGGTQSQSRSTFSKMIPDNSEQPASFFAFYNITEKFAVVVGMLSFGLIEQLTGSMRNSSTSLSVFFIIALIVLAFTKLTPENEM